MSLLDRVHDLVTATGGALEAPVGFVKDVTFALPELGTLNLPDFTHDVYEALRTRGAEEADALIGPHGIGGTLVGALPGEARGDLGATLVNPFNNAMETAYHELIGQPLATAITAGALTKTRGLESLLTPKGLAESYNIAEHRSPGASLALAFLTHDALSPSEIAKAQGTDWYQVISGTTDAVARIALDPTALALGGVSNAAKATRAVRSAEAIEALTRSGAVAAFSDDVGRIIAEHGDGAAAVVRHTHFPTHEFGAQISDLLVHAETLPPGLVDGLSGSAARERVTRILMGAGDELEALRATRADLAGEIERLAERRDMLKVVSLNGDALAHSPEAMADIDRELNALYSQQYRIERLDDVSETVRTLPRTGGAVAARGRFTTGDFYQSSRTAKPLRVVTAMEPHPWIHLDNPESDISIWRMTQKVPEMPLEEQLAWRSRYMAAATPAARMAVATGAEERAITLIAEDAGMSSGELKGVLAEAGRGRKASKARLDSRAYDGQGRSVIPIEHEGGVTDHIVLQEYPLYETQLPNLHPMVDIDRVRDAISPIKSYLARNPGYQVGEDLLEQFARVWKPAVLLRVGFPIRNLADEALRSMAKVGVLSTLKNMGLGGADAVSEVLAKVGFTPRELKGFSLAGHQFEGAFGAPTDGERLYKKLLDARDSFGTLVSENEGKILDQLIASGPWRSVTPAEVAYPAAFEHAVNNQIGRSELGSRLLEEMVPPQARTSAMAEPDLLVADGLSNEFIAGDTINAAGRALLGDDEAAIAHVHDLVDQQIEHRLTEAIQRHDATSDDVGAALRNIEREADPTSLAPEQHAAVFEEATQQLDRYFYDRVVAKQGHPYASTPPAEGRVFTRLPYTPREEVIDNVVDWLKSTPEGQTLRRQLPARKHLDEWVGAAYDQIDAYLPTDQLKAAAWGGHATHDMLVEIFPNSAARPIVHGGVVAERMGGPIGRAWRGIVDTGMKNLVARPSNYLIRNRFFDHMYQSEVARQVGILTGEREMSLTERMRRFIGGDSTHANVHFIEPTADDFAKIERRARRYALGQVRGLFDNFSEEFSFARSLGMLSPFANAWAQIGTRWAGLAIDNPAFARRLQLVWRSPERAGLVTDGAGNVVDSDGRIVTPVVGSQYRAGDPAADGQRNVTISLPEWAKDVPGLKGVGTFKFGKSSINMLLHGLPSVGPMVQVGFNEIAKEKPELESSLKWALPYGVTQNSLDILKPTLVRRIQTQAEGDENRSFVYSAMRIYTDKLVDYNLGKRTEKPTWAEARADANAFWHMRTVASFVLPVTPQFNSPYQPYIDAYRARRDFDANLTSQQRQLPSYATPDEWFLDTYGAEFFPLVASMSKSIDGIPPTLEGQAIHEEYGDLLSKYPELGGLLVGSDGAGEFNRAVYEGQFEQRIGPGTSRKEREVQPIEEFGTQASVKLGWIQFSRAMDMLDALRVQRGLASYQVSGAQDLARMKAALISYLGNSPKYEGWYADYADSDSAKWDKRIAGMTEMVGNEKVAARPEMVGLKRYLSGRRDIVNALDEIGTKRLDSNAATTLRLGWEAYIGQLVDENPAFGALYNRWLSNDPVAISPITLAAQAGNVTL